MTTLTEKKYPVHSPSVLCVGINTDICSMDWEQKKTEDGKLYYFNTQNNETSWVKPGLLSDPAVNPTDWEEQTTQTGKTYYLNKKTNEITWEPPEEFLH